MMTQKNAEIFDETQVREHLGFLFDSVEFEPNQYVCLRGIGEKGTHQEGKFREEFFFEPAREPGWIDRVTEHCNRWGQHNVASFIVPCVLRAPKATSANVSVFTSIVADFDSGNTLERIDWVKRNIGEPDLLIESGGLTEEGTPKLHAWYKIDPTSDIEGVINLRHDIAEKSGADLMLGRGVKSNPFGRAHQPVRIAGTVHSKNGNAKPCRIRSRVMDPIASCHVFFAEGVASKPYAPWATPAPESKIIQAGNLFGPDSGNLIDDSQHEAVDLTTDVHAGGEGSRTRFSEFNRVAGHYLHCARRGDMPLDEAFEALSGWVQAHMVPPWPQNRVRSEWEGLLRQDVSSKGPMPKRKELAEDTPPIQANHLLDWAAHKWIVDPVPTHTELVEGLVLKGEPHLFVAEGGAGKTFLVADLALKVAAHRDSSPQIWCGQKIKAGGTAVLILCEDSQTEMHIRIRQLNQGGLIDQAGDRLIVLPMTVVGGAFPLTERDPRTGSTVTHTKWRQMLDAMKSLPEPPVLVAIDTLNSVSHGDENSNVVIAEMMREAHRVCGEMGAALIINHHLRKSNEPLRSLEELKNGIRGASAIPSYFRICFGMFHASDYDRRMTGMNLTPRRGALWKFGIAKANIHGLLKGERTLLRNDIGLLEDVTDRDYYAAVNISERMAWLIFAVKTAASNLHPYAVGGKNAANGLYKRRAELPKLLRAVGWREFSNLVEECLQRGMLVACAVAGSKSKSYLDVLGGTISSDEAGVTIASGAYTSGPDWDEYTFDSESGEIIRAGRSKAWKTSFIGTPMGGKSGATIEVEDDEFEG